MVVHISYEFTVPQRSYGLEEEEEERANRQGKKARLSLYDPAAL
jgi:hypothetical protein